MKKKLKEYGRLGIFIYFSISFTTLSSFYYLLKTKKLDPVKCFDYFEEYHLHKYLPVEKLKELTVKDGAYFALAIILNKAIIIFRLPLTLIILFILKKFR